MLRVSSNESCGRYQYFISGAMKAASLPGVAAKLAINHGQLLKSADTEYELMEVLARPKIMPLVDHEYVEWIKRSFAVAELVIPSVRITICRDPKDDQFLELAVAGNADLIITGDMDLIALSPFRDIPIVTPAIFVLAAQR